MKLSCTDFSYNNFTGSFPVNLVQDGDSNLQVLNLAGNQFGGALPDLAFDNIQPFKYLGSLRTLDISYNNFQGVFSLSFFSSTQNLTLLDVTGNYFIGPAPNVTIEGRPVHTRTNCFDSPAKHQRPASVCAALPAPPCSVDNDCQNWLPGLLGQDLAIQQSCMYAYCNSTTLQCTRGNKDDDAFCNTPVAGIDRTCADFGCQDGSCVVMFYYPVGLSCYLEPDFNNFQCQLNGACDGGGHCVYDYAATANTSCDYIPGNDFCHVQKCRNGTCAQVYPTPDGGDCALALDVIDGLYPGPFAENKGCATASCMNGTCTLSLLFPDGTPCNITGLNTELTELISPECVIGKCSEGICQTDSYKSDDTPCGGPCETGCCKFCDGQGFCPPNESSDCYDYEDGYPGQCDEFNNCTPIEG
eukprot:SM000099S25195  [mRNA]  locus=s99:47070:50570:- [translate_table: standard]